MAVVCLEFPYEKQSRRIEKKESKINEITYMHLLTEKYTIAFLVIVFEFLFSTKRGETQITERKI